MRTHHRISLVLGVLSLLTSLAWAGGTGEAASAQAVKIVFPYYQVGNHTGAKDFAERNVRFNEKYKGKYQVEIEEIAGDTNYIEKIKVLYGAGKLPPVYELKTDPMLSESIYKNKKYVNLRPYLDADPAWRAVFTDMAVDNATYDGAVVCLPSASTSYIGIFYNKELFAKAGISEFPKTWDAFWVACDKLEKIGVKAIALHTTETGWCPNLMVSAYVGSQGQTGYDFMRTLYPTDFGRPFMVEAARMVQRLFKYAPASAVGGSYPMAANDFYNETAAMIPNGPWMIAQFHDPKSAPEGFAAKVGSALYPGGVAIGGDHVIIPKGLPGGFHASPEYAPEVVKGAVEWLKFITSPQEVITFSLAMGSIPSRVALPEDYYSKLDPIAAELYRLVKKDLKRDVNGFQGVWDSVVMNEVIPQDMPALALGKITPEEYCAKLTEGALRFQKTNK